MDIGWIDDLIAIEEKGSLSKAAESRNVTQPAFSRRIVAIEQWFGAEIVNRSNRPLRLSSEMASMMPTLHDVAATLRHLRSELQASQGDTSKVVIAAQHSLLEAHKDLEWAQARIHAYEVRIERLTRYVEAP